MGFQFLTVNDSEISHAARQLNAVAPHSRINCSTIAIIMEREVPSAAS